MFGWLRKELKKKINGCVLRKKNLKIKKEKRDGMEQNIWCSMIYTHGDVWHQRHPVEFERQYSMVAKAAIVTTTATTSATRPLLKVEGGGERGAM